MGFFATIIWSAVGTAVLLFYIGLLLSRVSKGLHIWGKPIPQEKFQSIKITYGMILIAIIFFAFVYPHTLPKPKEDPNAWKTKDNTTMAYVMMQEFVKRNLVSPASAKFEWITEPDCKIEKDGFTYTVSSWVDSQNSFGAIIRNRFSGEVRQVDDDNWELISLSFEE